VDALLVALTIHWVRLDHVQHASEHFCSQQGRDERCRLVTHLRHRGEQSLQQLHCSKARSSDLRHDKLCLVDVIIGGLVVQHHQAVVGHVCEECLEQFVDFALVFLGNFLVRIRKLVDDHREQVQGIRQILLVRFAFAADLGEAIQAHRLSQNVEAVIILAEF